MSDAQIEDLGRYETSSHFDATERTVCRFAEQLTEKADVDEDVVEELKQVFDPGEMVELAVTVGAANLTNRVNHAFDIPLEE